MAEDKFAPKANDGTDVVHKLHRELIASQQAENKKNREEAAKPKPKVETHVAEKALPTQPPAPQNPEAPQNKPVE